MLLACAVFWYMNLLTPYKEDDMAFALIGRDGASLLDLLRARYEHFLTTNGRFSDAVATVFCAFLGKPLFNVCNTLVFGLLAHLMSRFSARRASVLVLVMFLTYVGCSYPVPGETMLFLAGSCNYMWAITASLLLVAYLERCHERRLGWGRGVLLFVCAFFAGNFNEATTMGFFGGLVLYYAFNRQRLSPTVVVAMAGYLLGVLVIIASPALWSRAGGELVSDMGVAELLSTRWHIFIDKMWRFITPVAALAVGVVALLWRGYRPVTRSLWTWVLICLVAVMFALGLFSERAYSPLATVAFIITAMAAHTLLERWPWPRLAVVLLGLALTVFSWTRAVRAVEAYKAYEDRNMQEIAAAPREAILQERQFDGYSRFVTALRYVSSEYFVREDLYQAYYDKDNLQFVSDSVYARYHSGRLLEGARELPLSCDRPDVVGRFLAFPSQDYMVVELQADTFPYTSQQALYYNAVDDDALTDDELAYRRKYGIVTDYTPRGFYPLRYQGRLLLVFPLMEKNILRVVFPVEGGKSPAEATVTWQAVTEP